MFIEVLSPVAHGQTSIGIIGSIARIESFSNDGPEAGRSASSIVRVRCCAQKGMDMALRLYATSV